jgi:antitoxin VapB
MATARVSTVRRAPKVDRLPSAFYPSTMSLNIKNERTVRLVRELAERTGQSQTSAVESAVAAQLETLGASPNGSERERRNARARAALAELHATVTDADRAAARAAQQDLYDDAGLPR